MNCRIGWYTYFFPAINSLGDMAIVAIASRLLGSTLKVFILAIALSPLPLSIWYLVQYVELAETTKIVYSNTRFAKITVLLKRWLQSHP